MKYINYIPEHKYPWLPVLYSLIVSFKPKTIIEFGTALGGTAITMGLALKELQEEEGHNGIIYTYDTFEVQSKGEIGSNPDFQYANHNVNNYPVLVKEFIKIDRGDFFEFNKNPNKQYDLLYFDIDNDGEKLLEMYQNNIKNVEQGAIIIFEGGSEVRDNVPWMIEKNKVKMNKVKVPYTLLTPNQKYSCSIIYNPEIYNLSL
jgi:predicted O-methyltransferase YrrM